jgi:hypothetical protein
MVKNDLSSALKYPPIVGNQGRNPFPLYLCVLLYYNRENSLIFARIFRPRPRSRRRRPRLGANQIERSSLCPSDFWKFANLAEKAFEDEDDDEGRGRFGCGCAVLSLCGEF